MEDPCFERLVTPRLTLRRFAATDAEAFAAYRDDPDVARYQSWELPYTLVEAKRFIDSQATASPGAPGRRFQFAVDLEASATLVGDCALCCMRHELPEAELGFSFAKSEQRRGYASEAIAAILRYAFTTLSLRRVFACTDTRNEAAQCLLERHGFRREEQPCEAPWFRGEGAGGILYAQLRSEWLEVVGAEMPAGGKP